MAKNPIPRGLYHTPIRFASAFRKLSDHLTVFIPMTILPKITRDLLHNLQGCVILNIVNLSAVNDCSVVLYGSKKAHEFKFILINCKDIF